MRNAFAICRRELLAFFVSPVAYFVITGFLLLAAYFFFMLLLQFNMFLMQYQQMPYMMGNQLPNLNQWVVEPYYGTLLVVLIFLVPLLTMRVFAEDKRRGTFELLVTSPLSVGEIVFGKFLGVAAVVVVMMLLIFAFPLLLSLYAGPEFYPVLSGLLGILLYTFGLVAVGMAVSAFTENQIVAGIVGMVALLLLYMIHWPAQSFGGNTAEVLNSLSPVMEVKDLLRGVISLKAIVYFISLISVGLFVSLRALEAYRWR